MLTKNLLQVLLVPASVLALSATASADVNCANLTVRCKTFTRGTAQFSPVLQGVPGGTCPPSNPPDLEAIGIKGTLSDCAASDPSVKIVSGSVKGSLYTNDCSCDSLTPQSIPLTTPPAGRLNSLAVKWKFVDGSACQDGKSSTLVMTPGLANITVKLLVLPFPFGIQEMLSLAPPWVGVTGIFRNADGRGDASVFAGISTEDVFGLIDKCFGVRGLNRVTFGQGAAALE